VTAYEIAAQVQYVSSPDIRRGVRAALLHQLGLDLPPALDGVS
jgi:hypothetical protein